MAASGWLVRARSIGQSAPLAVVLLVGANLIPLAGVVFFDWDVPMILIAYWLENGAIGLLNIPKILMARAPTPPTTRIKGLGSGGGNGTIALFFAAHYGLFWLVHGMFVVFLTGRAFTTGFDAPFRVILAEPPVLIAAVALLISHAVSFWLNYVGRGEYRTASAGAQMWQPYPRLFVLHVSLVIGGVFIIGAREPVIFLALLVVLKTVVDLFLHLREHRRAQATVGVAT